MKKFTLVKFSLFTHNGCKTIKLKYKKQKRKQRAPVTELKYVTALSGITFINNSLYFTSLIINKIITNMQSINKI